MNPFTNIVLRSERGKKPKLVYQDRIYRFNNTYNGIDGFTTTNYYICCGDKCSARLKEVIIQDNEVITGGDEVTHTLSCVGNPAEVLRQQAKVYVLESVALRSMKITNAVSEAMLHLRRLIGDEEAAQFPQSINMKTTANRLRREILGSPPNNFESLQEIPNELGITISSADRFLLVYERFYEDDGTNSGTILVFATREDLLKLFSAEVISGDGTFKIKPRPYASRRGAQVYTLNTFFGTDPTTMRLYRRLLALLPSKSEACYKAFLRLTFEAAARHYDIDVLNEHTRVQWKKLMCDFELGHMNAFLEVVRDDLQLDQFEFEGCHMHYCSAIIKKIKELGLGPVYSTEASQFRALLVQKLFAMAFLPADLIVATYEYMTATVLPPAMMADAQVRSLLDYYENQWLHNDSMPIERWSVFDRWDEAKRTNNNIEGMHRHYLEYFGLHSDLWTFIQTLRKSHEDKVSEELQFEFGGQPPARMSEADRRKETALSAFKQRFLRNEINAFQFIERVANYMRRYNMRDDVDDDVPVAAPVLPAGAHESDEDDD